jgi:hypothetical protein
MFRALFILSEYKQRGFELENHDILLLETLVSLGQVDKALHWLLDGQKLRVRDSLSSIEGVQKKALNLSVKIAQAEFADEARELFSLAEPLHILRRGDPIPTGPRGDNLDVVQAWVEAAPLFREVSDIVSQIQSLQWKPSERFPETSEQQVTRFWRNDLLRRLGESLIALGRWDDALQVASAFDLQQHLVDRRQWFWLYRSIWWAAYNQGQQDLARRMIEEAHSVFQLDALREKLVKLRDQSDKVKLEENAGETGRIYENIRAIQSLRVALARDILLICQENDLAAIWIEDIHWSELTGERYQIEGTLDVLDERLTLYSLFQALGKPLPKDSAIIPDRRQREYDSGKTILARTALHIARWRGERWAGKQHRSYHFKSIASSLVSSGFRHHERTTVFGMFTLDNQEE